MPPAVPPSPHARIVFGGGHRDAGDASFRILGETLRVRLVQELQKAEKTVSQLVDAIERPAQRPREQHGSDPIALRYVTRSPLI